MTHFLHSEADLRAGLAELVIADPRLKPVAEKAGAFNLRRREPGFPGLCAIVCGQQLSTASAAAIRALLFAAFDPFHHDTVRRARADKLRRLGLSAPKIKSIREIGKAVAKGRIDLTAVGKRMPFRPATSPCRNPHALLLVCANVRTPRRSPRSPRPGGRGAAWQPICFGPIIMS